MNILVIDNYDSFTFNLVHYLEELNCEVTVKRNDQFEMGEVAAFDKIVLSPGPGIPDEAGMLKPVIEKYAKTIPMLGVCLGHQAIAEVFGGTLTNLSTVFHGVSSSMTSTARRSNYLPIYLKVSKLGAIILGWLTNRLPKGFIIVSGRRQHGQVMAFKHEKYPLYGVQFHPESVLTPQGKKMLENWVSL